MSYRADSGLAPLEEVVATDELRSAQRTSARSHQRFDTATVQPALPSPDGAGHGPQAFLSDLQRREAEQIAGASFRELAGNLPRHQQRPVKQPQNGLGCPVKWIGSFWLGVWFWCERNDCLSCNSGPVDNSPLGARDRTDCHGRLPPIMWP
jgi:hypothetical protein